MAHTLASANALLAAKSFSAARRAAQELIAARPDDPALLAFAVTVEVEAGEHGKALELAREALRTSPDNITLREQEVWALGALRRKDEAIAAVRRFEQDFPLHRWRLNEMNLMLDALHERTIQLKARLDEAIERSGHDPATLRDLGIAYHKIADFYKAQRLMLAAHRHFPGDIRLNEALAENSFQLVRPATARKHAALALMAAPDHSRMRFLRNASYLLYFPPLFILGHLFLLAFISGTIFGKLGLIATSIILLISFGDMQAIWWDLLSVAAQWPIERYWLIIFFSFGAIYFVAVEEKLYRWVNRRDRGLKVRKY